MNLKSLKITFDNIYIIPWIKGTRKKACFVNFSAIFYNVNLNSIFDIYAEIKRNKNSLFWETQMRLFNEQLENILNRY